TDVGKEYSPRRGRKNLPVAVNRTKRDRFNSVRQVLHLFHLRLGGRTALCLRRKIAQTLDAGSDSGDKLGLLEPRVQGIEPVDIVVHDFDSAQHEGSIRAVILCTAVGSELKPPKPTAEADHVRHLLI